LLILFPAMILAAIISCIWFVWNWQYDD